MAVNDLQLATTAASQGDTYALRLRLVGTVERLLSGLLVDVVPIRHIENTSDEAGMLSDPIIAAVHDIADLMTARLGSVSSASMASEMATWIDGLMDPMHEFVLPMIFGPVREAIAAGLATGTPGPTGTPLDPTLVTVGEVVSGGEYRDPVRGLLRTLIGASGRKCVLNDTALSGLCGLLGG